MREIKIAGSGISGMCAATNLAAQSIIEKKDYDKLWKKGSCCLLQRWQ